MRPPVSVLPHEPLDLKPGETILVKGRLPPGEFLLGKHVAVVGFAQTKRSVTDRQHDRRFPAGGPQSPTGRREVAFEVDRGPSAGVNSAHLLKCQQHGIPYLDHMSA